MPTLLLISLILFAQVRDPGLSVSKAVYEQKVQSAEQEAAARLKDLDSGYVSTLKSLFKAFQEKGDLEPLLAVRSELERFEKAKNVTGADVVSFPTELVETQRRYLAARDKITKDRQLTVARAARVYLDDLEPAKRSLTRIGEIDAAVAINEEIKRVTASVDLSVLEKPAETARPAPVKPEPAAPATSVVVDPPGLRPLRDDIWVHALRNGVPVRDVKFTFIPSGAGKTQELATDQMGRISLRAEATRFHIALISDQYEYQEVRDASAGHTYQFRLADAVPGSGVVIVRGRDRQVNLPGAGTVTINQWSGSDGKTGPAFHAQRARFVHPRNPRSTNSFIHARYDEPFRILDGDKQYEAVVFRLSAGDGFIVRYKPVTGAP